MPSGSGSGIIDSLTFMPDAEGKLIVTAAFEAAGSSGGDWGAAYLTKAFMTQNGVTTYGDAIPMSTSRQSQTVRHVFDGVSSGLGVECGVYGEISGAVAATWWNVTLSAELIKR